MAKKSAPKKANSKVMELLNKVYISEMSGVIRYMHYSFMIMGHNRIPIQKWLRDQSTESMAHAVMIGEKITALGGHPSMDIPAVKETNHHSVNSLLEESLEHEKEGLELYKKLVKAAGTDIAIEEMAREFVRTETEHIEEVEKMLRQM